MLVTVKDTDDLNIHKDIDRVLYAPSTSKSKYKFLMIYLWNGMDNSSVSATNSKLLKTDVIKLFWLEVIL